MSFKYCSFYGISAPIILLFTRQEIDLIFEHGMSGSACRLLANLRYELLALKEFLSNKSAIDMAEDTDSATVKYFIDGLSMQLDKKHPTAPTGGNKSDYFSSDLSEDEKLFLDMLAQTTKLSGDFIDIGRSAPEDYQARFKNIFEVKRYVMREMASELSESEQQLVKSQLAKLPRKPSGKVFLEGKTLDLKVSNPPLASLLTSLYASAFKRVDNTTMLDYILSKIEIVLDRNPVYGTTLLGRAFPNLQEIKTVRKANAHNLQIVNGPLSTENQQARSSAIMSYLADCDSMLDTHAQAVKFTLSRNINFSSMSMADIAMLILDTKVFREAGLIDAHSELVSLLKFLQSKDLHQAMVVNYRELLFLTFILYKLSSLESGGAAYGWGLAEYVSSIDDLNKIGIEAAKVFKLGGIYAGYTQHVYETIMICNKTFTRDNYVINKTSNPILYENVRLIQRYLLSLKERGA